MILKKFLIFALLACINVDVQARYIVWVETVLCICQSGSHELIAALPEAATKPQNFVFDWLKERGVPVIVGSDEFDMWAKCAYKFASGYGWRLEWPNLLLAEGVECWFIGGLPSRPGGSVSYRSPDDFYTQLGTINVENCTASQLRDMLKRLPTLAIDRIVSEFENHPRK